MIIKKLKIRGKKGIELEALGWWIIGVAVLIIMVIGYIYLKGKGSSALDFIQNLFKFGR